jgi:hypothetical protein
MIWKIPPQFQLGAVFWVTLPHAEAAIDLVLCVTARVLDYSILSFLLGRLQSETVHLEANTQNARLLSCETPR